MSTNTYRDLDEAIGDLLACAYAFDDKPHKLFSAIARIANQYGDADDAPEIDRLMMRAYERIGAAPQVWSDEEPQTQLAELDGKGPFDPTVWGFSRLTEDVYTMTRLSTTITIRDLAAFFPDLISESQLCWIRQTSPRELDLYVGTYPSTTADGDTLMRLLGFERVSSDDATVNKTKD